MSHAVSGRDCVGEAHRTLLRTAIEHAGAERGLLMLAARGELSIPGEANISGGFVIVRPRETPVSTGRASGVAGSLCRAHAGDRDLDDALATIRFPPTSTPPSSVPVGTVLCPS